MFLLLPLVFSLPSAVAMLLFTEPQSPSALRSSFSSFVKTSLVTEIPDASLGTEIPDAPPASDQSTTNPLTTGTLYTSGKATVNWNGIIIPVENGTYGYVGNEIITIAPDGMGILQVDGGTIFLCPNSVARISRKADGSYDYQILSGLNRFAFDADTPFEIRVNELTLTPNKLQQDRGDKTAQTDQYIGEVKAN